LLRALRFLTAGESHGPALLGVLEGIPAGLPLSEEDIARDLRRRQMGYGRGGRMLIERDHARILSGVRHGRTLGSPIALLVENRDWPNWTTVMSPTPVEEAVPPVTRLRPGHADLPGVMKYFQADVRNVLERASARETAMRVAIGAVCRRFLEEFGVRIHSHTLCIGGVWAKTEGPVDWERVEASPVRCSDPQAEREMMAVIDRAKEAGDTVGGVVEVVAEGVPMGLGSYVQWDRRIDGRLAQAILSINAVKAVSIGEGWESAERFGSQVHDVILPPERPDNRDLSPAGPWRRASNRAGGTEGGMTNGMPLVVRFAVKPIATLGRPLPSVDLRTGEEVRAHYERSDVCQVPPAGVIGEAMVAIVLADAFLEKFGGDHLEETRRNYEGYLRTLGLRELP